MGAEDTTSGLKYADSVKATARPVCQTYTEANARLIAAAPRMLEMLRDRVTAPSGEVICVCRNRNAVNAGTERACWYCAARALLTEVEG